MSAPDNEELIDYEDEHDIVANGAAGSNGAAVGGDDKEKKNFSGIHSTGFRLVDAALILRTTHCLTFFFN